MALTLIGLALLTLSVAAFWPAADGDFVSDDLNAIVQNENVAGRVHLGGIFSTFSWWGANRGDAPGYRPLTTLSFALNRVASGWYTRPYHLTNFVLHAAVALTVFLLAQAFYLSRTTGICAAVIFCLLPLHGEAVCWIVGRAELLAALFVALCLLSSLAYLRSGGLLRLCGAGLFALAGLLSKENAIAVLPMPALACWLLRPRGERPLARTAVVSLGLLVATAAYFAIRASAGPLFPNTAGDLLDNPLTALPVGRRLLGALSVLGRYGLLLLWPWPLSADYSYDALGIHEGFAGDFHSVAGALILLGFLWALLRYRRALPGLSLALLLAALAYAPVSNTILLIGTIMGERLAYLPTLGLCIAAGEAAAAALGRWGRPAAAGLTLLLAFAFAVDYSQASRWQSAVALFESAAQAYPRSARAQMELGSAYGHAGQSQEARLAFSRAISIKPDYAAAWYNLANFLARNRRFEEAASAYESALEHAPALAPAWYNLTLVRQLQGRPQEALRTLQQAARRAPDDPAIHLRLAEFLEALGRASEAAASYGRALEAGADESAVRLSRGELLERSQGCRAALSDYLAVLARDPGNVAARSRAATCYRRLGRQDEANRLSPGR